MGAASMGDPVLGASNWGGLKTLYIKEVRRFFKVQMQTVWAPAITTSCTSPFLPSRWAKRAHRDGGSLRRFHRARPDRHGDDAKRLRQLELLPAGREDSRAISSTISMPPLSTGELIMELIGAAVTRAILVGFAVGWLCSCGQAYRLRSGGPSWCSASG